MFETSVPMQQNPLAGCQTRGQKMSEQTKKIGYKEKNLSVLCKMLLNVQYVCFNINFIIHHLYISVNELPLSFHTFLRYCQMKNCILVHINIQLTVTGANGEALRHALKHVEVEQVQELDYVTTHRKKVKVQIVLAPIP